MTRTSLPYALLTLLAFIGGAFVLSSGFFTIDEFILYAGAQAIRDGSFAVANGTDLFESGQLRLWLLVDGPQGLTPQYPPGTAIAGAPLLAIFGPTGLVLLNALAAAGIVAGTFRLGRDHFGGQESAIAAVLLLLFASFFLEYAFAVWPHAIGTLCILVATVLLLDLLKLEVLSLWRAGLIGAVLGLGMMFRADVAIAVPALAAALFVFREKPFKPLAAFAVGILPFLLALCWINSIKFEVFSPVSYGQADGGGTSLAAHVPILLAAGLVGILAFPAKWAWLRTSRKRPIALVACGLAFLAALLAHEHVWRYIHGFWALVIDATAISEQRAGIERMADGTTAFWGFWKKALAQSMPWLGLVPAAFFLKHGASRQAKGTAFILFVLWSLPFFPRAWHGGMGSNMRYFLPLLPLFCALAGSLLASMWQKVDEARTKALIGLVMGFAAVIIWIALHPSMDAGAQQILPTWVALSLLPLLVFTLHRGVGTGRLTAITLVATFLAIGVAVQLSLRDFQAAQETRQRAASLSSIHESLPERTLVFAPSRFLVGWALGPTRVNALPNPNTGRLDRRLMRQAFGEGYRVLVWHTYLEEELVRSSKFEVSTSEFGAEPHRLIEVRPAAGE